jgi:hypothetical protein
VHYSPVDLDKEQIKDWLKSHAKDREWLGEQIGTNKRTVDNWLSSPKQIPEAKLALIERAFHSEENQETTRRQKLLPQSQIFSLEVDLPTFRSYSAAALADGKTLEKWSIDELNAAAAHSANGTTPQPLDYLKHQPAPEALLVAENKRAKH